jgi:hypothetical protein
MSNTTEDGKFYLKKGKAFLTPEDISAETGFFVMDKVLNNTGLFVDQDIEYSTYKGFDSSFNKALFLSTFFLKIFVVF